jgi:hypothetical protein
MQTTPKINPDMINRLRAWCFMENGVGAENIAVSPATALPSNAGAVGCQLGESGSPFAREHVPINELGVINNEAVPDIP